MYLYFNRSFILSNRIKHSLLDIVRCFHKTYGKHILDIKYSVLPWLNMRI